MLRPLLTCLNFSEGHHRQGLLFCLYSLLPSMAKKDMLQKKTQKCKTSILLNSPVKWLRFSSVAQSCPTPWDPMNHSTSGLPVHHQLIAGSFFFSFFLSFICLTSCQTLFWGLPWWLSGKESTCECRIQGFDPWSGMIPHAAEQLSLHAATPEPML